MRCPCGSDRFDQRLNVRRDAQVVRWLPASDVTRFGLGSAPLGAFGGGSERRYGRVELTLVTGALAVHCLSCERLRREKPVGGGMAVGHWKTPDALFIVMSDVADPTCVTARFQSAAQSLEVGVEVAHVPIPASATPTATATTLPPGAVLADVVLRAPVPDEVRDAPETPFEALLFDKCLGFSQRVAMYNE